MGDGELDALDGESQDVVQPLLSITRKCKSHTDVNSAKSRRLSTPQPIKSRSVDQEPPTRNPSVKRRRQLKTSKSAPDLSSFGSDYMHRRPQLGRSFQASSEEAGDLAVAPGKLSPLDDDDDDSVSEGGNIAVSRAMNTACRKAILGQIFDCDQPTQAEALWDHMTLDPLEMRFTAGDVIEVMDMLDKDWWWGRIADKEGWFPSAFVMLRKRQSCDFVDECQDFGGDQTLRESLRQESAEHMSRARANVILDIVSSERDYVKHLRDVVEGYVEKARKRKEMFSDERISTIFGNIEQIYHFASAFLKDLEESVDLEEPNKSQIGIVFLNHEVGFEIYSEYCNNHPFACEELRLLQSDRKYQHFFEACRLLQQMIEIPLEGFLLTPVQKICKYPLQLKELLKYTHLEHADYASLQMALNMMKKTAMLINERKRKMESLEKLAQWQKTVAYWQGPSLLETSSELIYSGETSKVSSNGSLRLRILFLFDHQLIICKKDILWREMVVYKGRLQMDGCSIHRLQDNRGNTDVASLKYGFRLHDRSADSWLTFCCRNGAEEERWMMAFHEERQRVDLDLENRFDLNKFKDKAIHSQMMRSLHPTRGKEKSFRKKPMVPEEALAPSPTSQNVNSVLQPKKKLFGFMHRRYRR